MSIFRIPFVRRRLQQMVRRLYAGWPKRRIRPVMRVEITNDMRKAPLGLNHLLRRAGYTSGDRVVIVLEEDFARLARIAHKKTTNPITQLTLAMAEMAHVQRITDVRDVAAGAE